MKLKALDLFCGGGGACIGLQQAGFEVVGIDIKKHKHYPGHFIQADIHDLPVNPLDFDFVWASPPCQKWSIGSNCRKDGRDDTTVCAGDDDYTAWSSNKETKCQDRN